MFRPSCIIRLHNEEFANVTVKESKVILKICQNLFFKIKDTSVILQNVCPKDVLIKDTMTILELCSNSGPFNCKLQLRLSKSFNFSKNFEFRQNFKTTIVSLNSFDPF